MLEASVCLSLPDPRCEMILCYSGTEKQSLLVLEKVQGGETDPDALVQHPKLHNLAVVS